MFRNSEIAHMAECRLCGEVFPVETLEGVDGQDNIYVTKKEIGR
jgi:hypothetical protein